jgi:hypothetical protein
VLVLLCDLPLALRGQQTLKGFTDCGGAAREASREHGLIDRCEIPLRAPNLR